MLTMPRQLKSLFAAATLTAACAVAAAQTAGQPGPPNQNAVQQQQAAPIEHAYPNNTYALPNNSYAGPEAQSARARAMPPLQVVTLQPGQEVSPRGEATAEPAQGVFLRLGAHSVLREVSSDAARLELNLQRGVANITVHDPAKDQLILVDLPGGQTQILKNGLYTFNAGTGTARVLHGEALAFPGGDKTSNEQPVKVKELHAVAFSGPDTRAQEFGFDQARADVLPGTIRPPQDEWGGGAYGYGAYGDGFYGYPAPYWAYDSPLGWDYPYPAYGWGPWGGVGLGFTYFGGWGGGFHGGGFHGRR
jgi:hypothetical protein